MRLPTLAVVVLVLSGCAAEAPAPQAAESSAPVPDEPPQLARLQVTVVSSELQPVPNAQVSLDDTELAQRTNELGLAVFDEVDPGIYTVLVAKAGFRTKEDRGRQVTLAAGETTDIRFTLEAIVAATKDLTYQRTLVFRGFISCSFAVQGSSQSPCGRGPVRDPNDNSTHPWSIDNHQIASLVLEAEWQSSLPALPQYMHLSIQRAYTCTTTGCTYDGQLGFTQGPASPLRLLYPTEPGRFASDVLGKAPENYPRTIYSAFRSACSTGCTASIVFQQGFTAYGTAFYGEPAPADFSFRPK